jgi:hypothetical protein
MYLKSAYCSSARQCSNFHTPAQHLFKQKKFGKKEGGRAWTIDATMVNCGCPQVDCQMINPAVLSSSESRIYFWEKPKKKCLTEPAVCQQAIGGIFFTETWRPEALHRGLETSKSQPRSKVGNFVCMSGLNGSFFGVEHRGFLKEGSKTHLIAPMWPLKSPTFFSSSHLYSPWGRGGVGAGHTAFWTTMWWNHEVMLRNNQPIFKPSVDTIRTVLYTINHLLRIPWLLLAWSIRWHWQEWVLHDIASLS